MSNLISKKGPPPSKKTIDVPLLGNQQKWAENDFSSQKKTKKTGIFQNCFRCRVSGKAWDATIFFKIFDNCIIITQ